MAASSRLHVVIDTNVLFEGLTKQGGACGLVIDAWLADLFVAHVSNALAYEYVDVLASKLSKRRWQCLQPVLGELLDRAEFATIYFTWRPTSPDPDDEHVIDCAMNSGAFVVTSNLRDFKSAKSELGLRVISPAQLVSKLVES
jgi:putative PIN family toxin of toxin-antitoxin system